MKLIRLTVNMCLVLVISILTIILSPLLVSGLWIWFFWDLHFKSNAFSESVMERFFWE